MLSASVEVDGKVVSSIGPGLVCLIGLGKGDGDDEQDYVARKILGGRLWHNEESGKTWSQSVTQRNLEVLLVSQFTLFCKFKGNKADFHHAMGPTEARETYAGFVERVRKDYQADKVKDGVFGAMMNVALVNDGPVTVIVDSDHK